MPRAGADAAAAGRRSRGHLRGATGRRRCCHGHSGRHAAQAGRRAEVNATRTFRIAAIPADGVGQEVVAAGRQVLDALAAGSDGAFAFDWQEFGWGCGYYARTGRMMDDDGLTVL